ncbi:TonB family protein [Nonlabens xiamenensis]|uniref:TonB family protein n=1 Tax=Nonlabens xiamenensis TaxID=2341043 RepID=UPI000F6085B0|nr:TonB family protein [Nonlabens xiamenensis]
MGYLKTKEQKISATVSVLLIITLVLIFRFVSLINVIEPPEESGIAINFGNTAVGSGPVEPAKATKVTPESNPEPVTQETPQVDNVVTQDNTDAPSVPSDPENTDPVTKPVDKPVEAKPKPKPKPSSSVLDALNSVTGAETVDGDTDTGEGPGDGPGNKGDINGDPYANTYYGAPGSGSGGKGYGLAGRGKVAGRGVSPDCFETGRVIVEIQVDRNGNVVNAKAVSKGSTNMADCLQRAAVKSAKTYKFSAAPQAKPIQIGFVEVNFKVGE